MSTHTQRPAVAAGCKFETFSYLPPMDAARIRQQVQYIVARGWTPALEHCDPLDAGRSYWSLWKLPLFGENGVDRVLAETQACRQAYPDHHLRLVGYDIRRQTLGTSMVIYRAGG